jgi:hypothetical protein
MCVCVCVCVCVFVCLCVCVFVRVRLLTWNVKVKFTETKCCPSARHEDTWEGSESRAPVISNFNTRRKWVGSLHPGHFFSVKISFIATEKKLDLKATLDPVTNGIISCYWRDINHDSWVIQPVMLSRYRLTYHVSVIPLYIFEKCCR